MRYRFLPVLTLIWSMALPGFAAQSSAQTSPPAKSATPGPSSEILVVGRLDPNDAPVKTEVVPEMGRVGRALASEAQRFQRCASQPSTAELHKIVDRGPADPGAEAALHYFIVRNQACYIGYPFPSPAVPYLGECNPHLNDRGEQICRAVYDRGAIFERVLNKLGDPANLAAGLVIDRPTFDRFVLREEDRDRPSDSLDRRYFGLVGCMVSLNPEAAGQLLRSEPGSAGEARARGILIGYSGPCLGRLATVKAEPGQFRAYTAEALYNWLAAASNRPSLVTD